MKRILPRSAMARAAAPGLAALALMVAVAAPAAVRDARVVSDEIITTTTPSQNGSSPMWSVGAPLLVRTGGEVWASLSIHDPDAQPYCNTHWELWRRPAASGWGKVTQGPAASEREPCPLFRPDPESLVVSIQPKLLARETNSNGEIAWYCQPALAVFHPSRPDREPHLWTPDFGQGLEFTQHSYRSVGVDPVDRAFLLLVLDRENTYRPTWRDGEGAWHPLAPLEFPIRACYPNVGLRNRSAHVLAIGDIKEPNEHWKAEKTRVLKREWDYVFRRLFYTWSPDLAGEGFREAVEIDSVEDTAGWMFNLDLLVDGQDRAHLLWVRRTFDHGFIRDRFFPGQPNIESVRHAVVERGRVIAWETLLSRELSDEETGRRRPTTGRLHQLPDGRMVAVLVAEEPGGGDSALFLQEIDPGGRSSPAPVRVALARPPPTGWFFTNTVRGGSPPSHDLDLLGAEAKDGRISLRHIHVHLP